MLKKFLSVLLAVMMVVSVMAVGVVTSNAATTDGFTPEPNKLYFDVDGTGWTMGTKNKVAFHIFGGDLGTEANPSTPLAWGAKKEIGTATSGETGIFEVDPTDSKKHNLTLNPGVQYKIIFVRTDGANWTEQTYDLFFTVDCMGHVAYSTGDMYENPVDSSKKALAAYWRDLDADEYGPVLAISSIGNVVGSCIESGKTKNDLLVDFFAEEKTDYNGNTGYQNAHKYKCEIDPSVAGYKTEQKLVDDIGAGLGLTKDEVKEVLESDEVVAMFASTGLGCSWNYDASTLPGGSAHEHTAGEVQIENDVPSTCTVAGTYDEVTYCTECGEELTRETKYHELAAHTPGDVQIENDTPSTCTVAGSYDEVTYCTVCQAQLTRETKYHELAAHTPGDVQIENDTPSTCTVAGSYDEVTYCTVCQAQLTRETKYHELAAHTPGQPVHENVEDPGCETEGGYDEVVYCTDCQAQIGEAVHHTTDPLGHVDPLTSVEEVPAQGNKNGVKAHYVCERCGKKFADASGTQPVSDEDLVIPAESVRGDANGDGVFDTLDVTVLQRWLAEYELENFDPVAADADNDGEIDIIDVALMQRVLANMTTFEKWDAKHAKA